MSTPFTPPPSPVTQPQIAPLSTSQPVRVVLEQSHSKFWRRVLWGVLTISLLANLGMLGAYQSYYQSADDNLQEKYHSRSKDALDKVAIISVEGAILSGEGFVKQQIDRVRKDERVKAVVVRVDSPGGTVTGSDYIYHHLQKLIKDKPIPMVISMGSVAASGGYYVSMAAGAGEKRIYAEPTTWTGSIGVIIPHFDFSQLLQKWDVKDDSITSHPLKQMGSFTRQLPPEVREEERRILQELVNDSFSTFKAKVLASRPALAKDEDLQKSVFTGRIFTAKQAQQAGLVDELGFIEDAIDRAIELAALERGDVRVVKYMKPKGLLDDALFGGNSAARSFEWSALVELTAPRACFLWTSLPILLSSGRD